MGSRFRLWSLVVVSLAALGMVPVAVGAIAVKKPHDSKSPAAGSIVVHGRWVITVRRQNGTVVSRRTFENSYDGGGTLASFLDRQESVGLWEVRLIGTACGTGNVSGRCLIGESGTGDAGTLTVTGPPAFIKNDLVLTGTVQATEKGTIVSVETVNFGCVNTVAPSTPCSPSTSLAFTAKALSPAISVTGAGQSIAVTVTISFS
jgi:hypothetical protein